MGESLIDFIAGLMIGLVIGIFVLLIYREAVVNDCKDFGLSEMGNQYISCSIRERVNNV